ncbi:MAG: triose-phosphate isomerase [Pseudomonadota bacterium]|nr:triose-phosphate isomerase [Pseudomonadota bacterium]
MRPRLVAANWKMNGSFDMLRRYVEGLDLSPVRLDDVDVVLCPPSVYVADLVRTLGDATRVACGGQDVGIQLSGAHTGELAAEMLADAGARWVIVGHSERRIEQAEQDDLVAAKATAGLRGGLRPIICVGETLAEREGGLAFTVVARQLEAVVEQVDLAGLAKGAIAYEPVWAIGTGKTASAAQAQEMHAFIRDKLARIDADVAAQMRIVYGGSVKAENAAELFDQADIDGGLIGGAGLDPRVFTEIVKIAARDR